MKKILFIIAVVVSIGLLSNLADAYLSDFVNGVRPAGMGEAFVSVADDANTIIHNVAGMSRLDQIELVGMYSDLYSGLNARLYNGDADRLGYNFLALAVPIAPEIGSVGTD